MCLFYVISIDFIVLSILYIIIILWTLLFSHWTLRVHVRYKRLINTILQYITYSPVLRSYVEVEVAVLGSRP